MASSQGKWYLYDDSGNVVGPLTTEDLQNRLDAGKLEKSSEIWNEDEKEWIPLKQIPGVEVPEPLGLTGDPDDGNTVGKSDDSPLENNPIQYDSGNIHCEIHPATEAVGHCINCDRLLCEDCIRFERNGSYCPECFPEDLERIPEQVPSEFFNRWYYYARQYPSVGITLVFIGFIALTLIFGPATKTVLSDQFGSGDSKMYHHQLNRTLYRAQKLSADNDQSSRQWFQLARSAASRILNNEDATQPLKEHAILHSLRINHELQRWDDFRSHLNRARELLAGSGNNPNLTFFRALYLLDHESSPKEARRLFSELQRFFNPRSPSIEPPRIPETIKYPIFDTLKYTRHELLYQIGRSYRKLGQNDEAAGYFLKISVDDNSSWWQRRAEDLMRQ